jgi:hypothetical protein
VCEVYDRVIGMALLVFQEQLRRSGVYPVWPAPRMIGPIRA